jgi:hypothetical protein
MAKLGDIYDKNPAHALAQAESCGYVLAAELLAIGVDFSFAPVLDSGKCLPTHFMPASCMPLIRLPANFTTTSGLEWKALSPITEDVA